MNLDYKPALLAALRTLRPDYVLADYNVGLINELSMWLAMDTQGLIDFAAQQGYPDEKALDPQRGIRLVGDPGRGKSVMLIALGNAMAAIGWAGHRTIHARALADLYVKGGPASIEPFYSGNLCIDDVGTEPDVRHMGGKPTNVLAEVIERRWDSFDRGQGCYTHITSNHDNEWLSERYTIDGHDRFGSRLCGMTRGTVLTGPDHRLRAMARTIRKPIEPIRVSAPWSAETQMKFDEMMRGFRARKAATVIALRPERQAADARHFEKEYRAKLVGYTDAQLPTLRAKLSHEYRTELHLAEPFLALIDAEMATRAASAEKTMEG